MSTNKEEILSLLNSAIRGPVYENPDSPDVELAKRAAALALNFVPVGMFGRPLFEALIRLGENTCVETVCLRRNSEGVLYVYAPKRPAGEAYEGERHVPGVYRKSGEFWKDVIRRVVQKEYTDGGKRPVKLLRSEYVTQVTGMEQRGWLTSRIYLLAVDGDLPAADCFPVEEVIDNTTGERFIDFHRQRIIPLAASHYEARDLTLTSDQRSRAARRYSELSKQFSDGDGVDFYQD